MLDLKDFPARRRRHNSAEYDSLGDVKCTCSHVSGVAPRRDPFPVAERSASLLGSIGAGSSSSSSRGAGARYGRAEAARPARTYRRSVSLGQILQGWDSSEDSSTLYGDTPYRAAPQQLGAAGSSSSEAPAESVPHRPTPPEELSDFEKENLLFVRELDNSYHRPPDDARSHASLGSAYSLDSLSGESSPRGGSPYPGRRETPLFSRTAYSPSKTSHSQIIRSISREEDEDELSEDEARRDEVPSVSEDDTGRARKFSLPALLGRGTASESWASSSNSSLVGPSPAWWSNAPPRTPRTPFTLSTSTSPRSSVFTDLRMVFSGRSLSYPADHSETRDNVAGTSTRTVTTEGPALTTFRALAVGKDTEHKPALSDKKEEKNLTISNPSTPNPNPTPTTTHNLTTSTSTTACSGTSSGGSSVRDGVVGPEEEERRSSPEEVKKPTPMAFTIELGPDGANGGADGPKKLDICASISKWAPKHRRNLSLTKVDEHKKVEERVGKPPVGRPRSGTVGATGLQQRRPGGYHSEGYFSSDQDDEVPRRTELKSPRSPRAPELRSPQTPQRLVRSNSQDSAKGASLRMRTPSPDNCSRTSHTMTLNESASYLIEKMISSTPEAQRKQQGRPEGRTCCKADRKPTVAEVTGRTKSDKGSKNCPKMTAEGRKQSNSANSLSSGQTYDVRQEAASEGKEEKDDVSEAGTYTIEKDSSSPEVEQARHDIDRVFGVSGTESEVDVVTPRNPAPTEDPWTPPPEHDKFKSPSSLSRNSPNWIQQWAAQVAEHTKSPDGSLKTSLPSPRAKVAPLTSLSSSQESSDSRPRRKLPTPPSHHTPYAAVPSPTTKSAHLSDHETPAKPRARVDKGLHHHHHHHHGLRGSSFESHDSGGDSDLDTSTSYPTHDDDDRLLKISSQLKTKLKLAGIDGGSKTPPTSAGPRKADPHMLDSRLKMLGHFKRERSIVSDGGYEVYASARDNSMQSDSSSDASDTNKDSRKSTDNNPPLKFNRAFSLRRARLACEEATQPHKPVSPVDKKKLTRPSSAGSVGGSRRAPLTQSKSTSASRTTSQATTPKGGSTDFSRGDGGRFSLRIPRSGSTSAVSKSPSRPPSKKEGSGLSHRAAPRSNSTLSSKEVDFQNWKRRKNYDPMKAAAEGRKKQTDKKGDKNGTSSNLNSSERSPSPPASLLRSASFHGTEGMGVAGRWPRRPNHLYPSEDDGPYSLEEEQPQPVPHCSPLRRSPTSPHQLASPHTTSPARHPVLASARARRASYALSDDGETNLASPTRKTSLDESGSEGKRSPIGSTRGIVSSRSKTKMEALDNLVISTIHSLSVKVRTTSETLLQKLKSQYEEEGDRAALLEEVLAHLSESDQSLAIGQGRSTSRELAGILRNLKKIEHALEVIDRVMVCVDDEDEEELDDGDLDGSDGQHHWASSDY